PQPPAAAAAPLSRPHTADTSSTDVSEAEFVRPQTPLVSRLVDKNWRVRSDALSQLCDDLRSGADPDPYTPYLARMLADTNVAALERAIEAVKLLIQRHAQPLT